jgi:hypothetical protein
LNFYELSGPKWRMSGKRLQEEIRSDLIPLLSTAPTDEFHERARILKLHSQFQSQQRGTRDKEEELRLRLMTARPRLYHGPQFYLERLVEKVNRFDLRFRWYVESGEHESVVYDPDLTKPKSRKTGYPEPVADTQRRKLNPAMRLLGPERRITTIVGEKFIVGKQLSYEKSFRELLYGIIAESLENGGFTKLRMCPACVKVFLVSDLKQRFCEDSCRVDFNNKIRSERGYFSERRREKRAELEKEQKRLRERVDIQKFTTFLQRAGRRVQAESEIGLFIKKKVPGDWNSVNGWLKEMNRKSVEQIWNSVPNKVKGVFRDYFREVGARPSY